MSVTCKGIFVVGAKRTPFCSFGGALRETPASHVFATTAKDAIQTAGLDPTLIDNTVVGNVHYLSQCDGGKTPRYCGIYSGVPIDRPALGVNKACGSGLQAIITGALDILTGLAKVSLTGGTEVMSALPFLVKNARFGTTLGKSYHLEDYIPKQFLDSYSGLTIEKMAEDLAVKYGLSRRDVDEYAALSHCRWKAAQDSNVFDDEISKLTLTFKKKQVEVKMDDLPQPNISVEALGGLQTIVDGGSVVTAGNTSAPADGAAAVLLADEATITQHNLTPLARVTAWACVGSDPVANLGAGLAVRKLLDITGLNVDQVDLFESDGAAWACVGSDPMANLGAGLAVRKLLDIAGLNVDQVDLFELNETFASQALLTINELKLDGERVNTCGGAIAVGNPVGATGARMAVHLVHQLGRRKSRRGVVASSCGGGQGLALQIEAV